MPPDQPTNVTVTSQTTTSLGLTWTNGFSGSSDITGVEIEYKETVVTVGISLMEISIPGDASLESTYLTNLLPFRSYNICVFVVSRHDRSLPGKAIGETLSLCESNRSIFHPNLMTMVADTTLQSIAWVSSSTYFSFLSSRLSSSFPPTPPPPPTTTHSSFERTYNNKIGPPRYNYYCTRMAGGLCTTDN